MGDTSNQKLFHIAEIILDEEHFVARSPDIEHERNVAIFDLIEENYFEPAGSPGGPYQLFLSIQDNRLLFDIRLEDGSEHGQILLSISPFRRIVKDYFLICESYFEAIKTAVPSQIEAIDMGRRGLHNEGSELLKERLDGKITVDFNTARRLFTLICVLHIKG
ncbi:MAG: UPF0262 family protein [Alphaproteobacteria bacterium]|nr:MAG: UPF0262 family protein [Alphaproteobacteria bacterium]